MGIPMGAMARVVVNNSVQRALLCMVLLSPAVVMAAQVQVQGDIGIGHSDNIGRVSTGRQDTTITSLGLQFSVLRETRRLNADIHGDVAWLDYSQGDFSSEIIGNVGAAVRVFLVEDHVSWSFDDTFGQTRRDLFSAATPDNRENINYFSTGPTLRLNVGDAYHLDARARYALVSYEESPFDSSRASSLLSLERTLSANSRVSVQIGNQRIEPRGAAIFASYDRNEAYLQYDANGARTTALVDIGAAQIRRYDKNSTTLLMRFEVSRKVGLSSFSVKARREFTDAGNSLQEGREQLPGVDIDDAQSLAQTNDPFISQGAELGWNIAGRRTAIGISAGWFDENYFSSSSADRQRLTLGASATRQLGPRLSANAGVFFEKFDYRDVIGDNKQVSADLGVSWRPGRRLSVALSGNHARFSSELAGRGSSETRFWLRLRYGDEIQRGPVQSSRE